MVEYDISESLLLSMIILWPINIFQWDFEEAHGQWRGPTAKQQEGDEFPLQELPETPKPLNTCTCVVSGLLQKTLPGKEEDEGFTAVSLAKWQRTVIFSL